MIVFIFMEEPMKKYCVAAISVVVLLLISCESSPIRQRSNPLEISGVWYFADGYHAPDNSWTQNGIDEYEKISSDKIIASLGLNNYKSGISNYEFSIISYDNDEKTYIKKMTKAMVGFEKYIGKYQKVSWVKDGSTIIFKAYQMLNTIENAKSDQVVTAIGKCILIE
jgi:hypothetical protein